MILPQHVIDIYWWIHSYANAIVYIATAQEMQHTMLYQRVCSRHSI